jgi:hypothetical protein
MLLELILPGRSGGVPTEEPVKTNPPFVTPANEIGLVLVSMCMVGPPFADAFTVMGSALAQEGQSNAPTASAVAVTPSLAIFSSLSRSRGDRLSKSKGRFDFQILTKVTNY